MRWRVYFIIVALGLVTPAYAQEQMAGEGRAPGEETSSESIDTTGQPDHAPLPVVLVETPEQARHAAEREAKSDQHEADDLTVQQKAADAADRGAIAAAQQIMPIWLQVVFGAVGTGLLVWTLLLNSRATRDASTAAHASIRAADAAEKAYMMENRPWIKVTPTMVGPIDFNQRHVEAQFKVENVGKSPAVNVRLLLDARVVRIVQLEKRTIDEIVERHTKNAIHNVLMSALIFPNDPMETRAQGSIEEAALLNGSPANGVDLALICTAVYRSNLSATFYHTSVTYMVKDGKDAVRTDRRYEDKAERLTWRADPRLTSAN